MFRRGRTHQVLQTGSQIPIASASPRARLPRNQNSLHPRGSSSLQNDQPLQATRPQELRSLLHTLGYSQPSLCRFFSQNPQIVTLQQFDNLISSSTERFLYLFESGSLPPASPVSSHYLNESDILAHCTLQLSEESASVKSLVCKVCLELLIEPVEANCCNNLFCRCCVSKLNNCPCCRSSTPSFLLNVPVKRMVNDLAVTCKFCSLSTTRGDFSDHLKKCPRRPLKCKYCDELVAKSDAVKHLENHLDNVLKDCFL
ncbi:hypothetical protein RCL1_005657 [Eukaryota sp. TZLM3-RCL]